MTKAVNLFLAYAQDEDAWEVQEPFQALRKLTRAFEEVEEGTEEDVGDFQIDCLLCQCLIYLILHDHLNARATLRTVQESGKAHEVTSALAVLIESNKQIMFN